MTAIINSQIRVRTFSRLKYHQNFSLPYQDVLCTLVIFQHVTARGFMSRLVSHQHRDHSLSVSLTSAVVPRCSISLNEQDGNALGFRVSVTFKIPLRWNFQFQPLQHCLFGAPKSSVQRIDKNHINYFACSTSFSRFFVVLFAVVFRYFKETLRFDEA